MPIQMTAEMNEILQSVKKQLPAGFDIVETEKLDQIITERAVLLAIIARFKPILTGFSGKGDGNIGSMIGEIAPLIPQLQQDQQLQEHISLALKFV